MQEGGEIVREVDAFIRNGGSICSFAAEAAKHGQIDYHVLPFVWGACRTLDAPFQSFFVRGAREFGSPHYRGACVLIDAQDFVDRSTEERRLFTMREEIVLAMRRLTGWERYLPTCIVRHRVQKLLAGNHRGVIGPRCAGKETVFFGMGPEYHSGHRRYAPRTMIPLTIREDANEFIWRYPDLRDETYEEAMRRNIDNMRLLKFYEDAA